MGCCFSKRKQTNDLIESKTISEVHVNHAAVGDVEVDVIDEGQEKVKHTFNFSGKLIYLALYPYDGINDGDLAFKRGDRLDVEDDSIDDWWIAKNLRTKETGYVPNNYLRKDDDLPQNQEWYFDVDRNESVKFLVQPGIKAGTFLIRKSGRETDVLALSVKTETNVRHYKIKKGESSGRYYITQKRTFENVKDLVSHYRTVPDGLCVKLTDICPKTMPVLSFRDLEVERDQIIKAKKIGSGNFGEVYRGKLRNVLDVAVKTLKPGSMDPALFLEEAKNMHRLQHKNLVRLIAVCTNDEPILIITELMENGSLREYLMKDAGAKIEFSTLQDMARQIACGMTVLEEKNFIHRDLRAANILVSANLDVKVADFGLARFLDDDEIYSATGSKFPVKWTAPEAAKKKKFSIKSDVWSFGVLLYEMITFGKTPFTGLSGSEALEKLDRGYRLPAPESPVKYPDSFYDISMKCWHYDPDERPKFTELQNMLEPAHAQETYEETTLEP